MSVTDRVDELVPAAISRSSPNSSPSGAMASAIKSVSGSNVLSSRTLPRFVALGCGPSADFPPMDGLHSSGLSNEHLAGGLVSTVFIGYLLFVGRWYIVAKFPAWFTHSHKWFK